MARFVFRLEKVLEQRRREERERRRAVALLEGERVRAEDELRGTQAAISRGRADLRGALTGPVDAGALRAEAVAAAGLERRARALVLDLAGVHRRLEDARRDLLAATSRRRAVETLRERRYAAWRAEEERRETDMLDEVAMGRAARAAQGAGDAPHAQPVTEEVAP